MRITWLALLDSDRGSFCDRFLRNHLQFSISSSSSIAPVLATGILSLEKGSGDQKFAPGIENRVLKKLADRSSVLTELYEEIHKSIESIPPFNLGFPSETSQSSYYLGNAISESDAAIVSKILEQNAVFPKNTRLQKSKDDTEYDVLIASVKRELVAQFSLPSGQGHVRLLKGDHSSDLQLVCAELNEASKYAANDLQRNILSAYIESFQTGSLDIYSTSQRLWVQDKAPRVENIFGFVEPYRDPQGIRGEFEALYNDIRQENGFKNVIISNRMIAESQAKQYPFIEDSEAEQFRKHKFQASYCWVVLHELLGHGTGRMMVESMDEKFNFDIENPPINPLTGRPISSWAELVGAYLMDDSELLEMFGFTETSNIHAEDLTYNLYLQLGVDGLRGLSNFNVQSNKWGQAHSRAHFGILKCLLLNGGGVITISHNKPKQRLTVQVDRSKIRTRGKPALGKMLLHLHMFRCTADVEGCRTYYEKLSSVDGEYIEWRETVIVNKPPPLVFVQANTFRDGDTITLKEYEPTVEGVIASWAERQCERQIDLP
ncbi:dipeptidyl peptidase III [Metarhizium brunneum]